MVKAGRMISGKGSSAPMRRTSSMVRAMPLSGTLRPMAAMAARNSSRLSAFLMAGMVAPMWSTLYFSSTPISARARAVFSAVWPPRVGNSASGRSFSMILATVPGSMGSM